jgi:predicted DNA-binding transcriptional regulator AlpA
MLSLISKELSEIQKRIHEGKCKITYDEALELLSTLKNFSDNNKELSKAQAIDYIGISRSTFDRLIEKGVMPPGHKKQGFKELIWYEKELIQFLSENPHYNKTKKRYIDEKY